MPNPDRSIVAAALLWLRNHYHVGRRDENTRRAVIATVDHVIFDCEVEAAHHRAFREMYGVSSAVTVGPGETLDGGAIGHGVMIVRAALKQLTPKEAEHVLSHVLRELKEKQGV